MSDFLIDIDQKNLLNKVKELEMRLAALEQRPVTADTLDQLTNDLGTIRQGELLSAESGQPDDDDYTGLFWSHQGYVFTLNGIEYTIHLAGMKNGEIQFGMSSNNGAGIFAGGKGIIDLDAIKLIGILYALQLSAADPNGDNPRQGNLGMIYQDGKTIPSLCLTFLDSTINTQLITNGTFETGNLTGWTTTGGSPAVVTPGLDGNYLLSMPFGAKLSQTISISENKNYRLKFSVKRPGAGLAVQLNWQGSGYNLRVDYIYTNSSNLENIIKDYQAPYGATTVYLTLYGYSSSGINTLFDTISLQQNNDLVRKLFFDPDLFYFDGLTNRKVISGIREIFTPQKVAAVAKTTASGNCTGGTHYIEVTFTTADGETDPSIASDVVIVDISHKKITVPLPLGPWGTTGRNVYMSKNNTYGPFYLAANITDNTTISTDLSIADANLGAEVSGLNTTISRPVFPRSAIKFAHECQIFNSSGVSIPLVITNTSSQVAYGFYIDIASADANNGDRYTWDMLLEAGTYTFEVYYMTGTARGIYDLYVDGVVVSAGNDMYHNPGQYDKSDLFTYIIVSGSGYHKIELVINGKNGSSSDYRAGITYVLAAQATF